MSNIMWTYLTIRARYSRERPRAPVVMSCCGLGRHALSYRRVYQSAVLVPCLMHSYIFVIHTADYSLAPLYIHFWLFCVDDICIEHWWIFSKCRTGVSHCWLFAWRLGEGDIWDMWLYGRGVRTAGTGSRYYWRLWVALCRPLGKLGHQLECPRHWSADNPIWYWWEAIETRLSANLPL